MKDSIIILCGGGPAPGMNSVSMSVAKTFLSRGYRVIGLHGGYSGLFSKNARTEDIDFAKADRYFNRGGSYLEMSRFKPTDKDFEENFNLDLFKENNIKLIDVPGMGEDQDKDEEYAKLYRELLPQMDLVLWVMKADDRAIAEDKRFYKELVLPALEDNKPFFRLWL